MKLGKAIIGLKLLRSSIWNKLVFKIRKVQYGSNLKTYGTIFVRGKGKIQIGNNVTINSCREANPIGGDVKTILYAKENSVIYIGNNCGISNSALVSLKEIFIEDNVMIGGGCKIYDNDFHSIMFEYRTQIPDTHIKSAPILIKNGAFIGAGTIILKGVTIGKKSVVGAGSVVTKDIPDGEVWAGNPARFIKKLY